MEYRQGEAGFYGMIMTSYLLAYAAISLLTPDPAPAYTGRRSYPPCAVGLEGYRPRD